MANDLINGEGAGKPAPVVTDTSVWMYRGHDARLFASVGDVPANDGWKDAPYDLEAVAVEPEKRKPGRPRKADETPVDEVAPDGDSNAN